MADISLRSTNNINKQRSSSGSSHYIHSVAFAMNKKKGEYSQWIIS